MDTSSVEVRKKIYKLIKINKLSLNLLITIKLRKSFFVLLVVCASYTLKIYKQKQKTQQKIIINVFNIKHMFRKSAWPLKKATLFIQTTSLGEGAGERERGHLFPALCV